MGFLALDTRGLTYLRLAAIFLLMAEGLLHAQTVAVFGATDINGGSADLRGSLSNPTNINVVGCGVVLASTLVNPNPLKGGTGTTQITRNDLAAGPFQLEATGLSKNTRYSVKAYVTTASGTNYSNTATFTTLANHIPVLNVNGAGNVPAFSNTGSLGVARSYHAAVRLADGRVLVAGGSTGTTPLLDSAELYDPETAGWTTTGSLVIPRDSPRATLLSDGHVLLSGGVTPTTNTDSAEIYNPATGLWKLTGRMLSPRYGQTSTLLQNNTVLVVGGADVFNRILFSAELYDPPSAQWTATGSLGTARQHHTATLLANGMVLVVGGGRIEFTNSAEIYDPETGSWIPTGSLALARRYHSATLLGDGKVLVCGGQDQGNGSLSSAELYNPATGRWTPTGNLGAARNQHTATLLANGKTLVAGGRQPSFALASAELYDPNTGLWTPTASCVVTRTTHTATRLANGRVLIAGGGSTPFGGPLKSAMLYDNADAAVTGREGSPSHQAGTFSHAEGNSSVMLSASFGTVTQENATGLWRWTAISDDGPLTRSVSIVATDDRGATKALGFTQSVSNSIPTVGITPPTMATAGQPASFVFQASDPSSADQNAGFGWMLDYGDGSPITEVLSGTASPLATTHTFSKGGFYNISATAQDKDGGLSPPALVSITVAGTTALQAWKQLNFPEGDVEELLDSDGDGLVNLIEFAFGLDPKSGASAQLPATLKMGNHLVTSFDEPSGIRGSIVYAAEWSPDLLPESWMAVPDRGTGNDHIFRVPLLDRTKIFMRLKIIKL